MKPSFEIQANGLELSLMQPIVMGILNITPNSFYDGGRYNKDDAYIRRAETIVSEGAKIIDVGATTSRPGTPLSKAEDEWVRLKPVLKELRKRYPNTIISVDSYHASLVQPCADEGVNIINDVSGGAWDEQMYVEIAKQNMVYVMMHTQGKPAEMQKNPHYKDVLKEVLAFFEQAIAKLHQLHFNNIIVDPGYGFGKTIVHNYYLLAHQADFQKFKLPILAGMSRKSMLYKVLGNTAQDALNATTVVNTLALQNGAHILRVHDVKEAIETINIYQQYQQNC